MSVFTSGHKLTSGFFEFWLRHSIFSFDRRFEVWKIPPHSLDWTSEKQKTYNPCTMTFLWCRIAKVCLQMRFFSVNVSWKLTEFLYGRINKFIYYAGSRRKGVLIIGRYFIIYEKWNTLMLLLAENTSTPLVIRVHN